MSLSQTAEQSSADKPEPSGLKVEPARPSHAAANWMIYFSGRIATQAHEATGLGQEDIVTYFSNNGPSFTGKLIKDWQEMITDRSGQQVVLNAFAAENPDKPVGIARPNIDEEGTRWLSNVYVTQQMQGLGVGRALIEAGLDWHQGEEVRLRVAGYNERAQRLYESTGFVAVQAIEVGYRIGDVTVPQVEMVHPGR